MKKPVVDYRQFRLSKLNTPEFSHLKLLSGWIIYFILFFLTEKFVPENRCYIMHTSLDDIIPFYEYFIIPYVTWYLLIAGSIVYFALYNTGSFKKLMIYWFIAQITAMIIYVAFPNRQTLRPADFPRDNFFTDAVKFLYKIDTDTNVCPSMHVSFSLAMLSVWLKENGIYRWWKVFVTLFIIFVILSVSFIKQHSVLDIYAAFAQCAIIEIIVYRKYWTRKIKNIMKSDK